MTFDSKKWTNAVLVTAIAGTFVATASMAADEDDSKDPVVYGWKYRDAEKYAVDAEEVPSVYIIHMKGQMGTDVNRQVYDQLEEDIREKNPDLLVVKMDCADTTEAHYDFSERTEAGMVDMDEYRDLVRFFQVDLADFEQVLWINDSSGISSVVALSWENLYMKPGSRLGGLIVGRSFFENARSDSDKYGKYKAAFMSWMRAPLEHGGYDFKILDAMVMPEHQLSASFEGRTVTWSLDTKGEYVVDSTKEATTNLHAKDAEELLISDGTAEDLDDLAFLLGMREYRLIRSDGEKVIDDYIEDWRKAFDRAKHEFEEYQKHTGWATGEDTVKYLGKAKRNLEGILSLMRRYKAVELRMGQDFGLRMLDLEILIEQMKERLAAIKRAQRGNRGGGGGGTGGSGLGGAGGGGGGGGRGR